MRASTYVAARLGGALLVAGCEAQEPRAVARRIDSAEDLVGGPRATGAVGDHLLANDQVRLVVGPGGIIDADVVRDEAMGGDRLVALSPALFLWSASGRVEVMRDGSDGGEARLRIVGWARDLDPAAAEVNRAVLPAGEALVLETTYALAPGERRVRVVTRLINAGPTPFDLTSGGFGDVAGWDPERTFAPGWGFNPWRTLEAAPVEGVPVELVAWSGGEVSYGLAPTAAEARLRFATDSAVAVWYGGLPDVLTPGQAVEVRRDFVIGAGDAGSIRAELFRHAGVGTSSFAGKVVDEQTGEPVGGASVIVLDGGGRPFSEAVSDATGTFRCQLPPGDYLYAVRSAGRPLLAPGEAVTVAEGRGLYREIHLPAPATLEVRVRDAAGRGVPAKVSVVSRQSCPAEPDVAACDRLAAERWADTELRAVELDGGVLRAVEAVLLAGGNGVAHGAVRPSCEPNQACSDYEIVVSRGPEYRVATVPGVVLRSGKTTRVEATVTRPLDTDHFVAAAAALDSETSPRGRLKIEQALALVAAEGVEVVAARELDLSALVSRQQLGDWILALDGVGPSRGLDASSLAGWLAAGATPPAVGTFTAAGPFDAGTRAYLALPPRGSGPRDRLVGPAAAVDLAAALQSGRGLVTNGPYLRLAVLTDGVDAALPFAPAGAFGERIGFGGDRIGMPIEARIQVTSTPEVSVDRLDVYAGGRLLETILVPDLRRPDGEAIDDNNTFARSWTFDGDVGIVVVARGSRSLFPMAARPYRPGAATDLGAGLARALGLEPVAQSEAVTPFAVTNPIWLDIDGDGEIR